MRLLTPLFPNIVLATIMGSTLVQYFCSKNVCCCVGSAVARECQA